MCCHCFTDYKPIGLGYSQRVLVSDAYTICIPIRNLVSIIDSFVNYFSVSHTFLDYHPIVYADNDGIVVT